MNSIELVKEKRSRILLRMILDTNPKNLINDCQLSTAAGILCYENIQELNCLYIPPTNWNSQIWKDLVNESYKERCITSATLLIEEVDRLIKEEENGIKD